MKTKQYTFIDRSGWPPGEWDNEPDKVQWQDKTGLPCIALRSYRMGNWCGYVGVPPGHRLHGKGYDDVDVGVHGGLTYADSCKGDQETGICHVPDKDEPHDVWWFGFDCAHLYDYSPHDVMLGLERGYPFGVMPEDRYRTLEYVKQQCALLAEQLKCLGSPKNE